MGTVSKTGVFNADGTDGGLAVGLGTPPDNAVYVGGPKEVDEAPMKDAEAVVPGYPVDIDANGDIIIALDGGKAVGYALENDLKADDGTVLDAYADGDQIPYQFAPGSRFAATVTIPQDGTDLTPGISLFSDGAGAYTTTNGGSDIPLAKYRGKTTVAANVGSGGAKTQRSVLEWLGAGDA